VLGSDGVAQTRLAHELSPGAADRTRFFVANRAPLAFYGYEAMALILDATAAGDGDRGAIVRAARATRDRDSVIGRYLATTTFVLVGVFLSFTAYWRESHATGVRGAAIIRDNMKAVAGIFVAEGSGRVYLARVNLADEDACRRAEGRDAGCEIVDDRSRLVGISKDEVTDIALGDPKPPWKALQQARHLARELCNLQVAQIC
jgi:hypothetical protein